MVDLRKVLLKWWLKRLWRRLTQKSITRAVQAGYGRSTRALLYYTNEWRRLAFTAQRYHLIKYLRAVRVVRSRVVRLPRFTPTLDLEISDGELEEADRAAAEFRRSQSGAVASDSESSQIDLVAAQQAADDRELEFPPFPFEIPPPYSLDLARALQQASRIRPASNTDQRGTEIFGYDCGMVPLPGRVVPYLYFKQYRFGSVVARSFRAWRDLTAAHRDVVCPRSPTPSTDEEAPALPSFPPGPVVIRRYIIDLADCPPDSPVAAQLRADDHPFDVCITSPAAASASDHSAEPTAEDEPASSTKAAAPVYLPTTTKAYPPKPRPKSRVAQALAEQAATNPPPVTARPISSRSARSRSPHVPWSHLPVRPPLIIRPLPKPAVVIRPLVKQPWLAIPPVPLQDLAPRWSRWQQTNGPKPPTGKAGSSGAGSGPPRPPKPLSGSAGVFPKAPRATYKHPTTGPSGEANRRVTSSESED